MKASSAEVHSLSDYENRVVEDVTSIATDSLISQVKELLPDLHDEFVKVPFLIRENNNCFSIKFYYLFS